MHALLYLETNYLLGVATGRYPEVNTLVAAKPSLCSLAIPRSCLMEAFAAVEGVLARRRRFSTLLDRRMRKLQTELLFPQAKAVLAQLETARFLNDRLIDEIRQRLFDAIESLLPHAIVIDEPPDLIVKSIRERLIPQPTDNLILHTILHHAATHPDVKKALLTANKKDFSREQPREAMKADAVALHGRYPAAIEWMTHACES